MTLASLLDTTVSSKYHSATLPWSVSYADAVLFIFAHEHLFIVSIF